MSMTNKKFACARDLRWVKWNFFMMARPTGFATVQTSPDANRGVVLRGPVQLFPALGGTSCHGKPLTFFDIGAPEVT